MTRFKAKTCGKSSDAEPRARLTPYTPELHFPEGLGTYPLPGRPGSQLNPQPRSPGSRSASPGVGPGRVRSPGPSPSPRGRNLKLPRGQGGGGGDLCAPPAPPSLTPDAPRPRSRITAGPPSGRADGAAGTQTARARSSGSRTCALGGARVTSEVPAQGLHFPEGSAPPEPVIGGRLQNDRRELRAFSVGLEMDAIPHLVGFLSFLNKMRNCRLKTPNDFST